jgi:general secretion pathway protein G
MKARKGFTLIEVLLVVLILAVLASIVVPRIAESTADAKKAKCAVNIANLICALELYAVDNDGAYPADQDAFDSLILNSTTYFPHGTPTCPYEDSYVYNATLKTVTAHSH